MNVCKHCQQPALYPPKTKWGGWCCVERFYDCPGFKLKQKLGKEQSSKITGFMPNNVPWNKGIIGNGTFNGKTHTEVTKTSISNSMKGNRNANHRGDRQSYYNNIRMDSKWEVGVAKYFDNNKVEWKYNVQGYQLSNGNYYYPDFFIYENGNFVKLVEVKGYFRESNKAKFEMFLNEYAHIQIELWQRTTLYDLGIINKSGYVIE